MNPIGITRIMENKSMKFKTVKVEPRDVVMGREYIVFSDEAIVVGNIEQLIAKDKLKSFEQPAHFYQKEAQYTVEDLNNRNIVKGYGDTFIAVRK